MKSESSKSLLFIDVVDDNVVDMDDDDELFNDNLRFLLFNILVSDDDAAAADLGGE